MKRQFLFLCLLLLGQITMALDATSYIAEGNKAYDAGEFSTALEQYLLADSLVESADLHLNLGNSYYKLGELGRSILHYERGALLAPSDEDLRHNLELARSLTLDKLESSERDAFSEWWNQIMLDIGMDKLAYISIFSAILSALAWALFWSSSQRGRKQLGFSMGAVFLVLCLFTAAMSISTMKNVTEHDSAIILGQRVKVLSAPNDEATELFILHEGTKVGYGEEQGSWTSISLANGNKGWMKSHQLEQI